MSNDSELLVGLSDEELEALADSLLAPAAQARLEDLLARQKEQALSESEERELDALLQKIDQLNILKTRARFTLRSGKGGNSPVMSVYISQELISAPDPLTLIDVALFHPQQDRWLEHFAWSADATQIVGLTPSGRATIAALKMNRQQMTRVRRMWVAMNEHPPELD